MNVASSALMLGSLGVARGMKKFAAPLFELALLHDIASAIERRGKSIQYRGRLECNRAVEAPFKRLNVNFGSPVHGYIWLSMAGALSLGR